MEIARFALLSWLACVFLVYLQWISEISELMCFSRKVEYKWKGGWCNYLILYRELSGRQSSIGIVFTK